MYGYLPSGVHKRAGHTIQTEHVYPPIGTRCCDWSATVAGYEPGDLIGWAATEEGAIADLLEQLEDAREQREVEDVARRLLAHGSM